MHREGWIDAAGVDRWRDAYEQAGIDPEDAPPAALIDASARAGAIAASDAPRAIASAEQLAPGKQVIVSPDLRETALEVPQWLPLRMPLGAWALAIGAQWALDSLRGMGASPDEMQRAERAATWLGDLARQHGSVVVVTHAAFRRLLAARLVSSGWRSEGERRSHENWSAWEFTRYGT